jgi:Zn-dependent protease
MIMKRSLFIGNYKEIKVFIHWTFLLLPLWIFISGLLNPQTFEVISWQILFIFAIFFCILLHEFGHALIARHFKFKTKDITLLPTGGVANIDVSPDMPKQELLVVLAGPAVNFIISGLLYIYLALTNTLPTEETFETLNAENFIFMLMSINFILAIFNLIPALPMDGGRALRVLLAFKVSWPHV